MTATLGPLAALALATLGAQQPTAPPAAPEPAGALAPVPVIEPRPDPEISPGPAEPAIETDDADQAPEGTDLQSGYTPPDGPSFSWGGYLDLGFARAQGNGTSFHPRDQGLPADYRVDPFAPAVNSRGEVASTDSGGRFTNGFLPRSVGIGGRPSFLINTLSFDLRHEPTPTPLMLFARVQLLPRFGAGGSDTRLLVEQAFVRLIPLSSQDLALSLGRFDPVFGIEYLENQANLRTGITPSLLARYTTGTPVGLKAFYRVQLPRLWSALSLNAALTNGGTFVEALQPPEISLTGRPVLSARLGYTLVLPHLDLKLGGSGLRGPRNDQGDPGAGQRALGADLRLGVAGFSLTAEVVRVDQDPGSAWDKRTGLGAQTVPSGFHARGGYLALAYTFSPEGAAVRATLYLRGEHRHAWFDGTLPITVQRLTGGVRLDLGPALALKAEYLLNREAAGAPPVANDVLAASAVYTF